jgi:hypothetical protein
MCVYSISVVLCVSRGFAVGLPRSPFDCIQDKEIKKPPQPNKRAVEP